MKAFHSILNSLLAVAGRAENLSLLPHCTSLFPLLFSSLSLSCHLSLSLLLSLPRSALQFSYLHMLQLLLYFFFRLRGGRNGVNVIRICICQAVNCLSRLLVLLSFVKFVFFFFLYSAIVCFVFRSCCFYIECVKRWRMQVFLCIFMSIRVRSIGVYNATIIQSRRVRANEYENREPPSCLQLTFALVLYWYTLAGSTCML